MGNRVTPTPQLLTRTCCELRLVHLTVKWPGNRSKVRGHNIQTCVGHGQKQAHLAVDKRWDATIHTRGSSESIQMVAKNMLRFSG